MMPLRHCPACTRRTIPVTRLIVSDVDCPGCGRPVGVYWPCRAAFFVIILAVTISVTVLVFLGQGLYAALLILPLPIGAIGYIKARYCPLVSKRPG